eukprot:SAG22_NODE_188_length_15821_cov_38.313319_29_plen_119_part_00
MQTQHSFLSSGCSVPLLTINYDGLRCRALSLARCAIASRPAAAGYIFGQDVVEEFNHRNSVSLVARAHQVNKTLSSLVLPRESHLSALPCGLSACLPACLSFCLSVCLLVCSWPGPTR